MTTSNKNVLQTATTIAKTTPTVIGFEINVSEHGILSLFLDYVNGDETGLNIYAYKLSEAGGTNYQDLTWTNTAGTIAAQTNLVYLGTASVNRDIDIDVSTMNYIVFKQGGSDNDGTPTGTLAVDYTLTR